MGSWAVDLVPTGSFVVAALFHLLVINTTIASVSYFSVFVGSVCWDISICSEAVANDHT